MFTINEEYKYTSLEIISISDNENYEVWIIDNRERQENEVYLVEKKKKIEYITSYPNNTYTETALSVLKEIISNRLK